MARFNRQIKLGKKQKMTVKDGLKSGAFTGDSSKGNPYEGDIQKGIDYDLYEANFPVPEEEGNPPRFLQGYRAGAKRLLQHSLTHNGLDNPSTVLDLGSGTGIATLEALLRFPSARVTGVEISPGMMAVARYKFNQEEGEELKKALPAPEELQYKTLLAYWDSFRKETAPHQRKVEFREGSILDLSFLEPESIEIVNANQVMHWAGEKLPIVFQHLHRVLKINGEVLWNSASHFYSDSHFPGTEYGFRYNDFLGFVMDEINKKVEVKDYHTLAKPVHNWDSVKELTCQQGFATEQVSTRLEPIDLQVFIKNHVPVFAKQLMVGEMAEEEKSRLINEAIAKAATNDKALQDIKHKYDIVPMFRSVKV